MLTGFGLVLATSVLIIVGAAIWSAESPGAGVPFLLVGALAALAGLFCMIQALRRS